MRDFREKWNMIFLTSHACTLGLHLVYIQKPLRRATVSMRKQQEWGSRAPHDLNW